ncbi:MULTISPECIES: hypothetical protein [unclassified Paenibacillus]|uniref:hypothetical protein n=1 Tax=unclassified Paenibacillus TaxID=185978 RepID=UPI001AE45791|nr:MULTISPECIES: hypothetical protein [unclassified Paenibacillus]MBP1155464.1 uncharacterized membrane protein YobD (UPF0266 family) [Paenibacillus sp. PvP091]MBP1169151.1 uncharacterized membrane protein YobD (UPF0266 family) [Paenibacillus sp. PvR098]MBP2440179.1 uncharacterized membrane protein YobD (UPF0266 family) [Paenibacillus sp. PvP052]
MSRKWERMVRKNTKVSNTQRKKSGKGEIAGVSADGSVTFKGRSWFLPMLLVATGVFCFITFRNQPGQEQLYWITGASYIFLAFLMYWIRRPFLKIDKKTLSSRRFGGNRFMEADQIKDITMSKDAIVINFKPKGKRWVFTKLYHLFPVDSAREKLQEYAEKNNVTLIKD